MPKNILIIEDNADIAHLVSVNLRGKHMQVDHAADGNAGLQKALTDRYQLVILDLMLPGMDGMNNRGQTTFYDVELEQKAGEIIVIGDRPRLP